MSVDLTTEYLGMKLATPLVAASCPLTGDMDCLQRLEQSGASAAVLPSLFEEQVEQEFNQIESLHDQPADSHAESLSYFPQLDRYNTGPDQYLKLIGDAKSRVEIPIIASLNGTTSAGWIHYAQMIEQAGANALELNIYSIPTEKTMPGIVVEQQYCDLVASIRNKVKLPLSVKLGPYFSSLPNLADQLVDAGANGLVLFNRYLAPDIDLNTLKFEPALELSSSEELRVALRWIAILRDQTQASLAATGGVHSASDVAKALLVGSDVVMIASALIRHGPDRLWSICRGLSEWLAENDYVSAAQLKGSMSTNTAVTPKSLNEQTTPKR